ncbi:cell division protein FtsI (penicillin-binding protein 3) [Streptoalloteichus tenebrarius]|uniref:Cell division protein FtsI (Penicillin-binding protein 3) n=2 Tax=Streptoalloteichus tenebrarius (strain ATCC 17920 / DSM 40477 / JCM 4838 / CBS 697.72 / NBRC 16177 / NCIMB 11028 / NRRL B-12390 / A12253. 1 / ISP 5477) TaxID=1933 RepID=A0ABT1HN70_STRSD|nr:cell division protein FtsI (penicillin-binding protein 3) [Streptoalloteichus tenebrarius]BFF00130.1 penicillin-binding protein 2 [Streptoalloteichus tenebrarius]
MQRANGPAPRRRPVRGVRTARPPAGSGHHRRRLVVGRTLLVVALLLAGVKLVQVQGLEADALSQKSQQQRLTTKKIPARRGAITDREGRQLALSEERRALYVLPKQLREEWDKPETIERTKLNADRRTEQIAKGMHEVLGDEFPEQELLAKLRSDRSFLYLADSVRPEQARQIREGLKFREIGEEYREVRQYPGAEPASNIIGLANWRMDNPNDQKVRGLLGLENLQDPLLAGRDGRRVVETALNNDDMVIPGTERQLEPATPGSTLELTIDSDVQYQVQRMLADYVRKSGAKNGSAVVLDAHTGEVYALANDKTFDPNDPDILKKLSNDDPRLGNPAVSSPFEPGSVNKVVTAAAGVEYGLVRPDTVLDVPGAIQVADRQIRDAWAHGPMRMTFTGVLAKSSNVGTIKVAQQVGEERFAEMLRRFGLGQATGVGLPGESAGVVPARQQWSGSTFGNLPIGQGLSMTVLQMAGMYQAIANDGVRVPPRIIRAEIGPDGQRKETKRPDGVKVVSPETARTVRDMLRAVVQDAPGQRGTGPQAALEGYQISGKTGTAQQVDKTCACYSTSQHWITFAGILPANAPRFVVGLMLDAPTGTPYSESAAPLFHDIASYLAQRFQIPTSEPGPVQQLVVG